MGIQAEILLRGEADAWYERCKDIPRLPDPVLDTLVHCNIRPTSVLEIGCGDGWRLKHLRMSYGCEVAGSDLSEKAVAIAKQSGFRVEQGWVHADMLNPADLIIFGFCLYLWDREDLFSLVRWIDDLLLDGGYIAIHDFFPDYPHKVAYKHKQGLWSYKMDYSKLWLGNPVYRMEYCTLIGGDDRTGVAVLKKDTANGWLERV